MCGGHLKLKVNRRASFFIGLYINFTLPPILLAICVKMIYVYTVYFVNSSF